MTTPERPEPASAEAVCATCGHAKVWHGVTVCVHCLDVAAGVEAAGSTDAGPHPFVPSQPEEAVPGGTLLEAAREAFLEKLRYWLADPLNTNTIGLPAVERDLDTLIGVARAEPPRLEAEVRALREVLGVIKRTAADPWNYDGKIVELATAALAPEPARSKRAHGA